MKNIKRAYAGKEQVLAVAGVKSFGRERKELLPPPADRQESLAKKKWTKWNTIKNL